MLPQTMGARFLYESFLRDLLKKHESSIDTALADASKATNSVANDVKNASAAASNEVKKDD